MPIVPGNKVAATTSANFVVGTEPIPAKAAVNKGVVKTTIAVTPKK